MSSKARRIRAARRSPAGIGPAVLLGLAWLAIGLAQHRPARAAGLLRIAPALARRATLNPDRTVAVWVYFTDRAGSEKDPAAFEAARRSLTARSLERRARRGTLLDLDVSDLPVHPS